ncbi:polyprenol monophosphomannose synthase [Bifidobacterium gallicum]|nr:polyprenol monophosphomannose synthase [Bifidobacterium gallicum]KFI59130.1 dolichyl-phosphate beta-D-mannosyltransferase [Bifidobacterium gallicum DSM 20093 = LMG 11596]
MRGGKVCVVMPTYDERDNLEPTLSDLFARNVGVDVLIVDDGSPDGTGTAADVIARVIGSRAGVPDARPTGDDESEPLWASSDASVSTADLAMAHRINKCTNGSHLYVLHRESKQGLGPAYIAGFTWALEHGYDVICEMDMDGSHRPEDLSRLLRVLEERDDVDVVLGSRRVPGGSTEDWPWYRDGISKAGSFYSRFMLGLDVRDMTSGFRAYRAAVLRRVDLNAIEANGYVFQIDMTRRVVDAGALVQEVPITFPERTRGKSKMDSTIVREAMGRVTVWGIRRMLGKPLS